MNGRASSPAMRAAVPTVTNQYAASASCGVYRASSFGGRGKSQSATPRIIIMTKPTRMACVWALVMYGDGSR